MIGLIVFCENTHALFDGPKKGTVGRLSKHVQGNVGDTVVCRSKAKMRFEEGKEGKRQVSRIVHWDKTNGNA